MRRLITVISLTIIWTTSWAADNHVFNQQNAPKTTHVFSSPPTHDPCTITVYLHGDLVKPFQKDVIENFQFSEAAKQAPGGIVLVPNLMSTCPGTKICRAKYYDNFSFKTFLEASLTHLQSKGMCVNGIDKISFIGHSAIYNVVDKRLLDEIISKDSCARPPGIMGKVQNIALIDSLFYTNPVSTERYKQFTNKLQHCPSANLHFAHLARNIRGHAPHTNNCALSGIRNCELSTQISMTSPTQFIVAQEKYNRGASSSPEHWDVVRDTLPQWFKIFHRPTDAATPTIRSQQDKK